LPIARLLKRTCRPLRPLPYPRKRHPPCSSPLFVKRHHLTGVENYPKFLLPREKLPFGGQKHTPLHLLREDDSPHHKESLCCSPIRFCSTHLCQCFPHTAIVRVLDQAPFLSYPEN